jgi:hypothetical protein
MKNAQITYQKNSQKIWRTFSHHKIRLLLSSLTTLITTKLPATHHTFFAKTPAKHLIHHTKKNPYQA